MKTETREKIRDAARRRANCKRCNGTVYFADGNDCGGFPGIIYKVCGGCGYAEATKKKRVPKGRGRCQISK